MPSLRPVRSGALLVCLSAAAGCGGGCDDADGPTLDDFLPPVPEPTGEPQVAYAGEVTSTDQVPSGAAASGIPGDFYIRNAEASFIVQSPTRVIGVVPQGGNLVDAVLLDGGGAPLTEDHLGEISMNYLLGRTCEHTSVEVVRDGAGGGVAAIVARGFAAPNDFINLKGTGILPVQSDLDPDPPDDVECATTYVLAPGSRTLEVHWTLWNAGARRIQGPFAALSDTGGAIETWGPTRGFERLGVDAIAGNLGDAAIEYDVFQGPGVAYGLLPIHAAPGALNSAYLIAGVSIVLFGATQFLDALGADGRYVDLEPGDAVTNRLDVVVGRDAADVEEAFRGALGRPTAAVAGAASLAGGGPATGARVALFLDDDGDGAVGPDDRVATYLDVDADGGFAGRIAPGRYLARADLHETSRSAVVAVDARADVDGIELALPDPVLYDFAVIDDDSGEPVPARLTVIGAHPAPPDARVFPASDRRAGVVTMQWPAHGTTIPIGDEPADPRLALPAGGSYRVIASRGPEWSYASVDLDPRAGDPVGDLEFRLRRVVDTTGYVASEYHVHSIGSPDSPVEWEHRIRTAAAEGVEVWASTEHEYVADLQPLVEAMGLQRWTRVVSGEEVSPFVYGHFIGFPLVPDPTSPDRGAVDWARGAGGLALLPGEIMEALRERGAEVVQVNHPRSTPGSLGDFLNYFDRTVLRFDYAGRSFGGDPARQPVPNDALRLEPGQELFAPDFDALEVWNNLAVADTDGDGVREAVSLDQVSRDWFNLLSFGAGVTPMGNSDTHTAVQDPVGLPRTMVRVDDDSADAIAGGDLLVAIYDALGGRGGAARDVVVTDGPMIRVTEIGGQASVIGAEIDGVGGVALRVTVQAATFAPFDTIEVFANATPEVGVDETVLQPLVCYTSRDLGSLADNDPCALAPLGVLPLPIDTVSLGGGFERLEAAVDVEIQAADVAAQTREGAVGDDVWIVVRARGQRGVFPVALTGIPLESLVRADPDETAAILLGQGLPAAAFTAAIRVDFDGGGYRAPFAPQ